MELYRSGKKWKEVVHKEKRFVVVIPISKIIDFFKRRKKK